MRKDKGAERNSVGVARQVEGKTLEEGMKWVGS